MNRRKFLCMLAALLGVVALFACARIPVAAQDDGNRAHFSADVDNKVNVHFQGDHGWVTTISGHGPKNIDFHFDRPLPDQAVTVFIRHQEGRGDISIRQQPSQENDYEAVIRINDPQDGWAHYDLSIGW